MTDQATPVAKEGRDPTTGQFVKGYKGGPGRNEGSRNKLGEAFIDALYADFQEHGAQAIIEARTTNPSNYLRVLAMLLPQKVLADVRHYVARLPEPAANHTEWQALVDQHKAGLLIDAKPVKTNGNGGAHD